MKRELTLQILLVAAALGLLLLVLLESQPIQVDTSTTLSPLATRSRDTPTGSDSRLPEGPGLTPQTETGYDRETPGAETNFDSSARTGAHSGGRDDLAELAQARLGRLGQAPPGSPGDRTPPGGWDSGPGNQESGVPEVPGARSLTRPRGASPLDPTGAGSSDGDATREPGDSAEDDSGDGPPIYWGAVPVPPGSGTRPRPTPSS